MVAFVGPSGTGKSTLLNLMLRFYDPGRALHLGGSTIGTCDRRLAPTYGVGRARQRDASLSVAENIAYGRPDATRDEIVAAAQMADAAEFVAGCLQGLIPSCARADGTYRAGKAADCDRSGALERGPVPDFRRAHQRARSAHEQRLVKTLRSLRRSRTIVLVTHRLKSTVHCDQVFVMEAGGCRARLAPST